MLSDHPHPADFATSSPGHEPWTVVPSAVYLDYQATTPCDPRVVAVMLPYFTSIFGNPHSRSHRFGLEAEDAVGTARAKVAKLIGARENEIVFTSGATESNNLAIKGAARFLGDTRRHIITSVIEHKCVLESCRDLEAEGFEVTFLGVDRNGRINVDDLAAALRPDTALVSIMAVNNEIGVIQPLAEIGALCRSRGVLFHTDAAQAVGKIPLDIEAMGIDLLSVSGHKVYGPKGIGALFVRRRPRVRLTPLFSGGGQERGLRSGTLPTPLCVGLGEACRIAGLEMEDEQRHLLPLRNRLYRGIVDRLSGVYLNGDPVERIPGNLNLGFAGVDGEELLTSLSDLAVSSGSACTSAAIEPSYVLRALGLDDDLARSSLRFGLGRFSSDHDVDYAIARVVEEVTRLRARDSGQNL